MCDGCISSLGVICHQHHHHNVCCLCDVLMVKIPLLVSHCCGPPTLSLTYKIVCHFNISLSYHYLQKNVRTWGGSIIPHYLSVLTFIISSPSGGQCLRKYTNRTSVPFDENPCPRFYHGCLIYCFLLKTGSETFSNTHKLRLWLYCF